MSLLIKNALIVSSSGAATSASDIFISADKISAVGDLSSKKADTVIDARRSYVSAGFIDVHNESDHYLSVFTRPDMAHFVKQGITTIIGGNSGVSLAPLAYGNLDALKRWTNISTINVNWHSLAELFDYFKTRPLGTNFMTLTGHETLRRDIIGENPRAATKNEVAVMAKSLENALNEGSAGLSTDLEFLYGRKASVPELKSLLVPASRAKGVWATRMRKYDKEMLDALREIIKISESVPLSATILSRFMPQFGLEDIYEKALSEIELLPAQSHFYFETHAFESSATEAVSFLPGWLREDDSPVILKKIADPWFRRKIVRDMPILYPKDLIIGYAPRHDFWIGKNMEEIGDGLGLSDPREIMLSFLEAVSLRGIIFARTVNPKVLLRAITSPRSLLGSNAADFHILQKGAGSAAKELPTSSFSRYLRMVCDDSILPLAEGIKKITSVPASLFGMKERGDIKQGYYADLVIFKGKEVTHTIVNGHVAMSDGRITGALAGRALEHTA